MKPCAWPDGVTIKPDGVHDLSPHNFVTVQILKNVTIEVVRCTVCGEISTAWYRQEDTEDITHEDKQEEKK